MRRTLLPATGCVTHHVPAERQSQRHRAAVAEQTLAWLGLFQAYPDQPQMSVAAALSCLLLLATWYGHQTRPAVAQATDPPRAALAQAAPDDARAARDRAETPSGQPDVAPAQAGIAPVDDPAGKASQAPAATSEREGTASALKSQAGDPSGTDPNAAAPPDDILGLILAGGPLNIVFMSVLGLFSLAAVAVALERLVQTSRRRLLPAPLLTGLAELIRRGELHPQAYHELCHRHPSPLACVLQAGLARLGRPANEIEKAMEDTLAREVSQLRARIRPLSVIGSVVPLVGLLGTVVGMLEAFRTASTAGLGKAELLAKGIYLALETTVAGLVIAIPAMLAAAWLGARVERAMFVIDERMMELLPLVPRMQQPPAERSGSRGGQNPLLSSRS